MIKQRQNIIFIVTSFSTFLVLYVASRTALSDVYLFEWTSRYWYFGIWLMAILLIIVKKQVIAVALTLGNLVGVVAGQVVGDLMLSAAIQKITPDMNAGQAAQLHLHHGVEIWLVTILIFCLTGLLLQLIYQKRAKEAKGTVNMG